MNNKVLLIALLLSIFIVLLYFVAGVPSSLAQLSLPRVSIFTNYDHTLYSTSTFKMFVSNPPTSPVFTYNVGASPVWNITRRNLDQCNLRRLNREGYRIVTSGPVVLGTGVPVATNGGVLTCSSLSSTSTPIISWAVLAIDAIAENQSVSY